MKLLVFAASHRMESVNRKLAKLAADYAAAHGATVDFAEYGEFDMPMYNDAAAAQAIPPEAKIFGARAAQADGIILCSPEYNWSYPGSVKNILDWTSRLRPNPLAGKTALLMSATPGSRGGIVGLNHLKTPLESLQMFVFPKVFPLGHSHTAFDEKNTLADETQKKLLISLLDDFSSFTQKLSQ